MSEEYETFDPLYWGKTQWEHSDIDGKPVKCDWSNDVESIRGDGFLRVTTRQDNSMQQVEITQERRSGSTKGFEELILTIPVCRFHLLRENPDGAGFLFGIPD